MKKAVFYTSIGIILLMHGIGLYGILYGSRDHYISLTWVNLLITGMCLLVYGLTRDKEKNRLRYFAFFFIVGLAGFLIEVAGTKSGKIFGVYHYGNRLGYQVMGVPLIIGLNWAVLIYACAGITTRVYENIWAKALAGATLMTLLDYLIEPVAIHFNYWSWDLKTIPVQNFIAWWIVSFVMLAVCFNFAGDMRNRLGIWIYGVQLVFFTLLNLLLK